VRVITVRLEGRTVSVWGLTKELYENLAQRMSQLKYAVNSRQGPSGEMLVDAVSCASSMLYHDIFRAVRDAARDGFSVKGKIRGGAPDAVPV